MRRELCYVEGGKLHRPEGPVICAVPSTSLRAGGPRTGWLDWLERNRSFRFVGLTGATCTVIRERRRGASGIYHHYWYAHRHVLGRLHRVYLGKAANLTLQRLEAAAGELAQLEMDGGGAARKAAKL